MRHMTRLMQRSALALAGLLLLALAWLWLAPPEVVRVGAGYTAKIVCSSVFISGRDPEEVLALDVQAPGHPLLRLMRVSVDREQRVVRAGLFGFAGRGLAVARDGTGCAAVPDGDLARAAAHRVPSAAAAGPPRAPWPDGEEVGAASPAVQALLDDAALVGPGLRAVVVLYQGRIVAERYGAGFDAATPLLGWSMTKTVTAALVGTLVRDARLDTARAALFPAWAGDARSRIAMTDLLSMSSGLSFNEDYGDVTDVTRMLYLEPDMAVFAARQPLVHPVGQHFSYASGTTVLLARLWQDAAGGNALGWPRRALFAPLGMRSAVMEADARGTFVGSSYMYANARDWARFALLLLQDGQWRGAPLLPPGWAVMMRTPSVAAPSEYGQAQMWRHGPTGGAPAGQNPDAPYALPEDTAWMLGHDGQSIAIVPSRGLAVVRLGLTPSKLGYRPQRLLQAVLRTL
jgi:CubicO group peptidase (beta-lactamase class C family)